MAADSNHFIGVDFGGTKILAGIFSPSLKLLKSVKLTTKSERGVEAVIDRITRAVRDVADEADLDLKQVRAIGLGAPGAVEPESGRVIYAINVGWTNVPLKKELEKGLGLPVFVENDCKASTLGVYHLELKGKPRSMVGVFLGTGVGGGLIFDGVLHPGANFAAGELGHMIIDMDGAKAGRAARGSFESLASRTAIFYRIKAAVKDGHKTILTDMLGADLEDMRSGDLRRALRRGDKLVEKVVAEAASHTGVAVANLINVLGPEVVALGGGVIEALGEEMMPIIQKRAEELVLPGTFDAVRIIASRLGDNAGISGAAVLAQARSK